MNRKVTCQVKSLTHELNEEAFQIFHSGEIYLGISNVENSSFIIEISDIEDGSKSDEVFAADAHAVFSIYFVALNAVTFGLFINSDGNNLSPSYDFFSCDGSLKGNGVVVHDIHNADLGARQITSNEIYLSICMFGALAKEKNSELISEYMKGIIHLGLNYPGAHFEKDAFSNFYRAFEYLITKRVLRVKRLSNELKQIQSALDNLGFSSEIQNVFKSLYIARGHHVMHAQKEIEKISREETMKMKAFVDMLLFKVYKPVWEQGMSNNTV